MKLFITIIVFFISSVCYSQDWVTNLQMQAGTWKSVGITFKSINDSSTTVAFVKVFNSFKTKPSNNSNVTLDSIPTLSLVAIYEYILFNVGFSGVLDDFQTSIQPKRATNAILDARCDELEARLAAIEASNILNGGKAYGN